MTPQHRSRSKADSCRAVQQTADRGIYLDHAQLWQWQDWPYCNAAKASKASNRPKEMLKSNSGSICNAAAAATSRDLASARRAMKAVSPAARLTNVASSGRRNIKRSAPPEFRSTVPPAAPG